MYADGNARGGVLEPEGIVEIKFRAADLVALMHRLDPIILELKAGSQPGTETAVKKREVELMPIYRQVTNFAVLKMLFGLLRVAVSISFDQSRVLHDTWMKMGEYVET